MSSTGFAAPPADKHDLEEGMAFTPRFDANGLITAVVMSAADRAPLMVAHMNEEALRLTIETGIAHYWSRSRKALWKKGETSGNLQHVVEIRTDCDQDAIWLSVTVDGHEATCHTGRPSCFYRLVKQTNGVVVLESDGTKPVFDPTKVYRKTN